MAKYRAETIGVAACDLRKGDMACCCYVYPRWVICKTRPADDTHQYGTFTAKCDAKKGQTVYA